MFLLAHHSWIRVETFIFTIWIVLFEAKFQDISGRVCAKNLSVALLLRVSNILRNIQLLLSINLLRNKGIGENVVITWKAQVSSLFTDLRIITNNPILISLRLQSNRFFLFSRKSINVLMYTLKVCIFKIPFNLFEVDQVLESMKGR